MTSSRREWLLTAALVGVAVVWGGTFVMVKDAVERFPLFAFLALRFTIALVAMLVIFPRALRSLDRATLGVGVLAGAFLCAGYVFQTWGLQGTTASKAAFITGMFVVFTPALQAGILRRFPSWSTLGGVGLAVAGLWLLSGGGDGGWNAGDTRVLVCAFAYAAHMIVLGSLGAERSALSLTLVQLGTTAVVCAAIWIATEPVALPGDRGVWFALIVTGILASAVAFAVQTYAQRFIPPARTALILITEPAFGGLFGWLAGETLGARGSGGAVLILGGMVAAELAALRVRSREPVVLEGALEGMAVPVEAPDRRPVDQR